MPQRIRETCGILLRRIDAFVFPPLCIVCDRPRADNDRWLCPTCRTEIITLITNRNGCPRCGQNRTHRTCACDVAWDYPFSRIRSFVDYTDTVQSLMHQIKYQGKSHLARYVGRLCSDYLNIADVAGAVVVPIPLHWLRRQKRGFNQAEWFARGLFEGIPEVSLNTTVLGRARNTSTQTQLDRSERRRNLSGAFKLTPAGKTAISGRPVILIDDVITTGATTSAAAAALLAEGDCRSVEVVSFARD